MTLRSTLLRPLALSLVLVGCNGDDPIEIDTATATDATDTTDTFTTQGPTSVSVTVTVSDTCYDYCDSNYDTGYDVGPDTDYTTEVTTDVTVTWTESDTSSWSDTDPTWTDTDSTFTDTDVTVTDTDPTWTDTDPTFTDTDTDTAATDTDTTATDTDATATDTASTDTDTTTTTDTDTDTDTDTTGGVDAFPPIEGFGDDEFGLQELDLVGTWSLHWSPNDADWNSELTIDAGGNFIWREVTNSCMQETFATGVVWVDYNQIVMHVDTWERQLPWDSQPYVGETFDAPFRLRLTYNLQGPYLGLAAPDRITEAQTYTGRAYTRDSIEGMFIAGAWSGYAELQAVPAGEMLAKVIVRDGFHAYLDAELGVDPEGTGTIVHDQTYWMVDPPVVGPILFEGGNWSCLNGCPPGGGATLINGGNLYAYGPYAGYQDLMTFATGRTFLRDAELLCP